MSETNYFTPFLCVKKESFVTDREWGGEVIIEKLCLDDSHVCMYVCMYV